MQNLIFWNESTTFLQRLYIVSMKSLEIFMKKAFENLDQCLWTRDWIKVKLSSTYGCVLAILMRMMALTCLMQLSWA